MGIHLPRALRRRLKGTGAVVVQQPSLKAEAEQAVMRLWSQYSRSFTLGFVSVFHFFLTLWLWLGCNWADFSESFHVFVHICIPQWLVESSHTEGTCCCQDRQLVLWIDNWYRPRFTSDPHRQDCSLNVSAMAVLHITGTSRFLGHPLLSELLSRVDEVAHDLFLHERAFLDAVRHIASETIQLEDIRVPLDVHRSGVRSLQWRPFMLTALTVSSQEELSHVVAFHIPFVLACCLKMSQFWYNFLFLGFQTQLRLSVDSSCCSRLCFWWIVPIGCMLIDIILIIQKCRAYFAGLFVCADASVEASSKFHTQALGWNKTEKKNRRCLRWHGGLYVRENNLKMYFGKKCILT